MKPRPFYRWKSFWLGLCVLLFLGWAWLRSMSRLDSVWFEVGAPFCRVISTMGKVGLEGAHLNADSILRIRSFKIDSEPGGGFDREWPPAFGRLVFEETDYQFWTVAYWFLVLLLSLVWCAWLFWHWKREKKKLSS